ncbi:beta-hexosaminidase [Verrucomicrobiota bacterium]|nr:beta-hexosaminidase [Verrucomicrobiota bacterium]
MVADHGRPGQADFHGQAGGGPGLSADRDLHPSPAWSVESGPSTIRLIKADKHGDFEFGPEGYAIINEPGKDLIIKAATEAGAFYAFYTLNDLSYQGSDSQLYARPGLLLDRPRFAWRGVMLDEGRHFLGKTEVKRLLHLMSLYKLNVLHWHLTEDQGWRVEIKQYPKLTEVGSRRDASPVMGDRKKSDGKPYVGSTRRKTSRRLSP